MRTLNEQNPFFNSPLYYRDVTGSTMDDCKKMSSRGILHGTVVQAGFQESGRGRIKGRQWQSSMGLNLIFTVVLQKALLKHDLNLMPLIAGAALALSAGEITRENFQLKWPNDLLYKGRKCAGILCEADSDYFYCGMGINCNQIAFPEDIRDKADSLKGITGRETDIQKLLISILGNLKSYMNEGELWRAHLESLLYKKGQYIEVLDGHAGSDLLIKGLNRGIGSDGQLLLEQENGIVREIYAGEIEL